MNYGIDIQTAKLVAKFTAKLWTDKTVQYRGRIYLNERDGKQIPEFYDSTKKRYKDTLLNRSFAATCFFDIDNEIDLEGSTAIAKVKICFATNLKTIYVNDLREDERAHQEIWTIIKDSNFKVQKLTTGKKASGNYELNKSEDDMQPYHLFCFETIIEYNINQC